MLQDFRHSLRALLRDFGFTATVVLTLAVGVGANTAVFGVLRAVLLEPLPYAEPDRLAMVWTTVPAQGISEAPSAYANILEWNRRASSIEDLAAFDPVSLTLGGGEWPEQVSAARVSAKLFALLGVAPTLGRGFSAEEASRQLPVAVLSHRLWERRFGASPEVVGDHIEIAGVSFEVSGVMPPGFAFPDRSTELWVPETLLGDWNAEVVRRGTDTWRVVARLAGDASVERAREELGGIARQLEAVHAANAGLGVAVVPLQEHVTGGSFRLAVWMLYGAVGLVLLIACANVAHLHVARAMDRAQGFAVRVALGATAPRLVRQTLAESVLLSLFAALASALVAAGALAAFVSLAPADLPRIEEIRLSTPALLYGLVVAVAAGLACAALPAARFARRAPYHALREGRTPSPRRARLRGVMIAGQLALAIVLVFGSNLLIRSLVAARGVDPGFDPDGVLSANLSVASPEERVGFYERVIVGVRAMPGVRSVGIVEDVFIGGSPNRPITIEGRVQAGPEAVEIRVDAIAGDLFETLRVPIRAGRSFLPGDAADATPVAVVNETMARRFWPGESPVGRRFRVGAPDGAWIEVVGVVADMRRQGPERAPIPQVFRPYVQATSRNMVLVVRGDGAAAELGTELRTRVAAIDPTVPLYRVEPLAQATDRYVLQRRFQTVLLAAFAGVALALAAVGIYGLVQYSVGQRTREIGMRLALGAASGQVIAMVLRQGLAVALPGLVIGLLCALWISEALASLLFGVVSSDLPSVLLASCVLLATVLAACWVPALRAARVDPLTALHDR